MNGLKNHNGRYCESDYENAFISFLEAEGWQYLAGNSMTRGSMREVLYVDDLEQFLHKTNPDLTTDEVRQIRENVRLAEAFNYMNVIEQWGSGLRRVSAELAAYGAKPLQLDDGGIDVQVNVFRNQPAVVPSRKGAQKNTLIGIVDGTMDGTMALRIVSTLKKEPSITIDKLSERLNVARRSLVRYMNILQKSNRIKRIGGKRFGHWDIV